MAVDFLTIANGQSVSSAYFIQRGDRPLVIVFPASCAAADYRLPVRDVEQGVCRG